MSGFNVSSTAFNSMGGIPPTYTCDGANVNPPLQWQGAPPGTKSFALIVDDPDAPGGMWVHWVLWNIPASAKDLAENSVPKGALQGMNDFRKQAYGGPCPPSGTHRYFFKLYALDATLSLAAKSTKGELEKAMQGHVLSKTELVGTYARK